LIIYVTAKNELLVGDETLSFDKLDSRIAEAARAKKHILIKADKKASMGKVVAIWDLCRDAGISNINIATGRK